MRAYWSQRSSPPNTKHSRVCFIQRCVKSCERFQRLRRPNKQPLGGLRALRGVAALFKIDIGGVEISIDAEPGLADSGDLQYDLPDLFEVIGRAAQDAGKGWILLIDEVQYLSQKDLAALIVAIHHVTQEGLPVLLIGAGLPQVARLAGDAKSYAERLFLYPALGPLSPKDAALAI